MKNKYDLLIENEKNGELSAYPSYPSGEDIYEQQKVVSDIDQEKNTEERGEGHEYEELNEAELGSELMGDDLDVPGSELDDMNEEIGSEDEENNYYSTGDNE